MSFTLQDLQDLATPASFSRGKAYFEEGAVHRLREQGEGFWAKVHGTERYTVELLLTPDGPDIFCDCPYDYEGICKHAVAVGLAVLEWQDRQSGPAAPVAPTTPAPDPAEQSLSAPSAAALEAALRQVPKAQKLKFLEERLRLEPALARAFLLYVNGTDTEADPLALDISLPGLAQLRDTLQLTLTQLYFDPATLDDGVLPLPPVPTRYQAPSPVVVARAHALLDMVLLPVATALRQAAQAGRLAEVVRRWQGAWTGIQASTKPATDAYAVFAGWRYPSMVLQRWQEMLTESGLLDLLATAAIDPAEASRCAPALTQTVRNQLSVPKYQPYYAGYPFAPDGNELLLNTLASNPSVAPELARALQPHESRLPAPLRLRLAAGCQDWPTWESLAATLAPTDATVALALMQRYQQQGNHDALAKIATKLFAQHRAVLAPLVLAHFTPATNRLLYVRALQYRCETQQQFADFEELTTLWLPAEREKFVKACLSGRPVRFGLLFRTQLLFAEGRGKEVLPLVLFSNWHPTLSAHYATVSPTDLDELPEVLALAAQLQPEATLDAVMERIEQYLDNKPRRSPELYQRIGEWLAALAALPALTEQVAVFVDGIYMVHRRIVRLLQVLRELNLLPLPDSEKELPPPRIRGRHKQQ